MTHDLPADERRLDEALERIHLTSATWRGALANHAPMAADALAELGRGEAIPAFLEAYGPNLEPAEPAAPVVLDDWRAHLGERSSAARLSGHFEALLDARAIDEVLATSLPVLMTGVLGGSLHGLIRVGHAVAALERVDTPLRRRELARGLGYWASEHRPLDGRLGANPQREVASALDALSPLPDEVRVDGIITERAAAAVASPTFRRELTAIDLSGPIEATLDALLLGAAQWLVREPASRFTYLHAITGTSALRSLLPRFVDEAARRDALRHHVHTLAAIRAMSRTTETAQSIEPRSLGSLIDAAVASRDDHQIKLAAAVRREHARLNDPRLLEAAAAFIH